MIKITRKNKTVLVEPDPRGLYDSIGYMHQPYQGEAEWRPLGQSRDAGFQTLPGFYSRICQWLQDRNIEYTTQDLRRKIPWNRDQVDITQQRTSGKKLLEALNRQENGILLGPCGMGKTHVIRGILDGLSSQVKVLLSTDDIGAATQLYQNLTELVPNRKIGIWCSQKKTSPQPCMVVTNDSLKALAANPIFAKAGLSLKDYDVWIADEAHTLPTPTILPYLTRIAAPMRYALTATLKRKDGAHSLLEGYFGPVLAEVTFDEGVQLGNIAPIELFIFPVPFIKKECKVPMECKDWRLTTFGLVRYRPLQHLIGEIHRTLPKDGGHLIFANWKKNCEILSKQIPSARVLHSKLPTPKIEEVKRRLRDGEPDCVITTDIIQKSFDAPSVKYITMAALGSQSDRTQRAGRATRLCEGKSHAQIHDFLFLQHPVLLQASINNIQAYRENGWAPKILLSRKDLDKILQTYPTLGGASQKLKQLEEFCHA